MFIIRKSKKKYHKDIFPILIISSCSIFLLFRSFFSFTWSDESFYLTIVHRLWLGELMFIDEWYTTQLSAPLLLPFYSIYQHITGTNEGVYLYFRILYWLLSTLSSFYIYYKIKKWNQTLPSLFCALIYIFYSRANINGLSYYNTTLTFVLLGLVLIYDNYMKEQPHIFDFFITGIFFALAVVITPYLALAYILMVTCLFFYPKTRKYCKFVFAVILGTTATALLYLFFVLSKIRISDILFNIPHVLNEPELQKTNPLFAIPLVFIRIAWRYKWTILPYIGLFLYICYKHTQKVTLNEKELKLMHWINLFIFVINFYLSSNMLGCVNIAFILYGIVFLILVPNLPLTTLKDFIPFAIGGLCLILTFTFSSDTGLDAMAIGFVVLAIGMVLCLFQNYRLYTNKLLHRFIIFIVLSIIFQTAFLRIFSVYRDAPLNQLNTQISSGPAKYLYTTPEHQEQYVDLQNDITSYVRNTDKVFYSKNCFWAYLCTPNEYGTPSSWRVSMDSPRLEEYFTINPNKIPTCIFVLKPQYGNFESSLIQGNEKTERPNENNLDGFLYDYVISNGYEIINAKSSLIFRKLNEN